jgi:hypothetical protein
MNVLRRSQSVFQADLDPHDVLDTGALIDETQPGDELRPG